MRGRGFQVDADSVERFARLLETEIVAELDAVLPDLAAGLQPRDRPLGNDPRYRGVVMIGARQQQRASDHLDRLRDLRSAIEALGRAVDGMGRRYVEVDRLNAMAVGDFERGSDSTEEATGT